MKKVPDIELTSEHAEASEEVSEHRATHSWSTNPEFALKPPPRLEDYADYVEHPRFGKAPRYTGLDPNPDSPGVRLHRFTGYHTEGQHRSWERMIADMGANSWPWPTSLREEIPVLVPGTAVEADLSRQTDSSTGPVTHYYDLDRICRDCKRKFLFFAEEQKHWYEDLGFTLDSDAIRCTDCRKRLQNIARTRQEFAQLRKGFEQLLALPSASVEETLEMVDCCLTLIEAEEFSIRQCERVRMLLKRVPEDRRSEEKFRDLTARLHVVEGRSRGGQDAAPTRDPVTIPDASASDEEPRG